MDFLHNIGHRDYLLLLLLSWAHRRGHASITEDFSVSCHVVSSVGLDTQSTTMKTNERVGYGGREGEEKEEAGSRWNRGWTLSLLELGFEPVTSRSQSNAFTTRPQPPPGLLIDMPSVIPVHVVVNLTSASCTQNLQTA